LFLLQFLISFEEEKAASQPFPRSSLGSWPPSQDKDAAFVENQQHNIDDVIDRLPRLAIGINVNIKFRR
ncbi:hypothetical protein Csa_019134, partial [Cucumis sativus]